MAVCLGLIARLPTSAQNSFINLDFESARLPVLAPGQQGGLVPVANAMPGWSASFRGSQSPDVFYNTPIFGSSAVWIIGPNFEVFGAPMPALDGRFTALLTAGDGPTYNSASISQTGLVPMNAQMIQAKIVTGSSDFVFSLNGLPILMNPITVTPNYILYGGDVSAFAGRMAELSITAPPSIAQPFYGFQLDSISFLPVPEPSAFIFIGVGGLFFGARNWRKYKRLLKDAGS